MREITYVEALREALREEMARDERVFIMGLDVRLGYTFGVTKGLVDEFGMERVIDMPISEETIVGAGVGAALVGLRPVIEIQFSDLLTLCMDPIANQGAKLRYITNGKLKIPLVVRTPGGVWNGFGCQHSQTFDSLFMHIPGIKVVVPSTPSDAKGLLKAAIRDDNLVLFLENKQLYRTKGPVSTEEYTIPIGKGALRREGIDVTIVAVSDMVRKALTAAEIVAKEGIKAEILDPRCLIPLDESIILNSVRKTGHLIIAEEGCKTSGVGAEIAALVAEKAFYSLASPILRVAAFDTPIPMSPPLQDLIIPGVQRIVDAIYQSVRK